MVTLSEFAAPRSAFNWANSAAPCLDATSGGRCITIRGFSAALLLVAGAERDELGVLGDEGQAHGLSLSFLHGTTSFSAPSGATITARRLFGFLRTAAALPAAPVRFFWFFIGSQLLRYSASAPLLRSDAGASGSQGSGSRVRVAL